MNKDKIPLVLGVIHNVNSPNFRKTREIINSVINANTRVAIESPYSVEEIQRLHDTSDSNHKFLYRMHELIVGKSSETIPVSNSKLDKVRDRIRWRYMFEEYDRMMSDWKFQKLEVFAGKYMLEESVKSQSDYLIVGVTHAYHMLSEGYDKVILVDKADDEIKRSEDRIIRNYGYILGDYIRSLKSKES